VCRNRETNTVCHTNGEFELDSKENRLDFLVEREIRTLSASVLASLSTKTFRDNLDLAEISSCHTRRYSCANCTYTADRDSHVCGVPWSSDHKCVESTRHNQLHSVLPRLIMPTVLRSGSYPPPASTQCLRWLCVRPILCGSSSFELRTDYTTEEWLQSRW